MVTADALEHWWERWGPEQLARSGHKLIFTTSFGFMEPTLKVAKKFPNVKFEHARKDKKRVRVIPAATEDAKPA